MLVIVLTSSSVRAQAVDVVVVGTRTPESVQRSTIRTGVVTREEAERRGARNVGEALAGEATLQVNPEAYGYLGRPSGVQMQGLDAERVLILEDGERVTGDVGGVIDLSRLSLSGVERIEYVTGPTSSLYGTNALGGVVNIVTAPPREEGSSGRTRLEARSRGDLLGEGSLAYRRDDHWAVADVGLAHSPSAPVDAGRPDTLVPRVGSRTLGLRLGTTLQRRMQLRLKLRWAHDDVLGRASEQVPGLGAYSIALPDVTDRVTLRAQETIQLSSRARLDFSLGRSRFTGESKRDRDSSPVDESRRRVLDTQSFESALTLEDGKTRTWIFGARSDTEQFGQDLRRTALALLGHVLGLGHSHCTGHAMTAVSMPGERMSLSKGDIDGITKLYA
jgi:outer membrane receptor for ferrienterochelin and colicins